MDILKGAKRAGEVHQASSRHVPVTQNSSAQCGLGEQQLWGDLFLLPMDVLTEDVRKDVPGSMMFADDIVLCGDDETDMAEYLETRRKSLEERGMRISRPKHKFMDFNFGQDNGQERDPVNILGEELHRVHHFKYLTSSVDETGGTATEITQRVCASWRNRKRCSVV